jgi:acyl-CoA hydrolase
MKTSKSADESSFEARKIVMPDQINPNNTLFGGVLMSWIDMLAYMTAQRHSENNRVVTVQIDHLSFERPIHIGDHVILKSRLIRVGNSSMDISVVAEREDGRHGNREVATRAVLTFVALDSAGKPVPVPKLKIIKQEDRFLFEEALLRSRIRKKFYSFILKKRGKIAMQQKSQASQKRSKIAQQSLPYLK